MLATAWPKKPLGRSEHPSIDVEIWKRNREYDHFCVKPTEIVRFFNQNIYLKRREKIQKIQFSTRKNIFWKKTPKNSTFPPRKKQQFTSRNLDSTSPSKRRHGVLSRWFCFYILGVAGGVEILQGEPFLEVFKLMFFIFLWPFPKNSDD